MAWTRPQSLHDVCIRKNDRANWHVLLREFLDEFYMADQSNRQGMIDQEPPLSNDNYFNAYLGAVAERLALEYGLQSPEWSSQKERFLHLPVFPCKLEGMKTFLLLTTPSAFKRRLIFTGDNPLSRPSKYAQNSFVVAAKELCRG
jgi:hypothetical protein